MFKFWIFLDASFDWREQRDAGLFLSPLFYPSFATGLMINSINWLQKLFRKRDFWLKFNLLIWLLGSLYLTLVVINLPSRFKNAWYQTCGMEMKFTVIRPMWFLVKLLMRRAQKGCLKFKEQTFSIMIKGLQTFLTFHKSLNFIRNQENHN